MASSCVRLKKPVSTYQQNLKERKIAIVVLSRNRWRLVERMIRKIVTAINNAEPGSYTLIDIPAR